jgi:putative spermidine/putrescine transport system ATP-binding protein
VELKAIQREAGITFVFVTPDQEEALTMSDRIAVFNGGLIEQVGTGADLYERPATPFVAGFVGTTNLVEGSKAERLFGAAGTWSLRPEHIDVQPITADAPEPSRAHTSRGTVREALYLGTSTRLVVDTDGDVELLADVPNLVGSPAAPSWVGRPVALEWSETNARKVSA